ncbi:hypothetical protein HGA92_00310 [Candidatus Gracilibacteria bacterium]|nr:hypothetical protein [Candidatus Gracilibacteria bacterium]NUJ98946.1 hypothetical protein [Candidatus Gracilibacteria bacterium]
MYNFVKNTHKNISGITIIDSGKPGENIGLIAITHGNEPVGLKIFEYLVNEFKINEKLKGGKIYLIANNIEAYIKYSKSEDKNKFRFIDDNMNRVSNKKFKNGSYEHKRFYELKQIFDEIDFVIDIHSVSKGNDLIGISDTKYKDKAEKFFDVETILIDEIGNTGSIIGEFIRKGKEAYGIECGNHVDDIGFKNGVINILNFLVYYGFINGRIDKKHDNIKIFEFIEEIKVKTDNFKFISDFINFTKIGENEIFAIDEYNELKHNLGTDIYLGIIAKNPKKGDGAGFLFRKLK